MEKIKHLFISGILILLFGFVLCNFHNVSLASKLPKVCIEADTAHQKSKLKKAINLYSKCLNKEDLSKSNTVTIYYNRGNAYADMEQYTKAIEDYSKAIKINPKHAKSYNNRGHNFQELGKMNKAIKNYKKAIELDPKYKIAYNNLGEIYSNQDQDKQAIKYYNKAVELKPKTGQPLYNRGNAYYDLKNYKNAIEDFSKVIKIHPSYAFVYEKRAKSFKKTQNYDKAIEDYKKVVELNPNDASIYNSIAWIYATASNKNFRNGEKAVKYAEKARSIKEVGWILDTLAAAYAQNGEFSKAVETEKKAIELAKETDSSQDRIDTYTKCLKLYKQNKLYDSSKIN